MKPDSTSNALQMEDIQDSVWEECPPWRLLFKKIDAVVEAINALIREKQRTRIVYNVADKGGKIE